MKNSTVMENVYRLCIDVMINHTAVRMIEKLGRLIQVISSTLDDGSDEPFDCANVTCPSEYFKCPLSGKCVPYEKICDGIEDCPLIDRINEISADERTKTCSKK